MSDPLHCFIPGPLNLQIKHWAILLKVFLLTDLCFVSLVQCPFSEHISPGCVKRAASGSCCSVGYSKFINSERVACPYCTKMWHCTPLGPQQHTRHAWSHWMNGSRHNKNASRQTDAHRFLPLLERKIYSGPSLRSFAYSMFITTEASKLKKTHIGRPLFLTHHFCDWIQNAALSSCCELISCCLAMNLHNYHFPFSNALRLLLLPF